MICSWADLPSSMWNYAGTCIQHPHRSNCVWLHILTLHLSKYVECILCLPTFHMSQFHGPVELGSKWPYYVMASCWRLSEHLPCSHIWHTGQPVYSPTKGSASQPLWMISSWACQPSSSASELAHPYSTRTKVNVKIRSFLLHLLEKLDCLLMLPSLTYLTSLLFHEKLFNFTLPGAMAATFTHTHEGFCQLTSQSAFCFFLCLKSGYQFCSHGIVGWRWSKVGALELELGGEDGSHTVEVLHLHHETPEMFSTLKTFSDLKMLRVKPKVKGILK